MNKKMFKRILALTLAVVMCFGMGLSAFAEEVKLTKAVLNFVDAKGNVLHATSEVYPNQDYNNIFATTVEVDGKDVAVAGWKLGEKVYKEFGWADVEENVSDSNVDVDGVVYLTFEVVYPEVEEPEEVKRTVTVTFAVNPEQGLFPDYVPSTTVTFENIDEFSEQQFEIPAVEAKEGYKFVGWKGQGADKIEWAADATTFGVTGLAFFQEGSNVGYASVEAVFEKIEAPAPAEKTLKIYWAIDNTDGAVFKASGKSDAWTETIAWADKDNTFVIPELEVKEGYKLAGWSVSGKEANYWDANASTFGLTGLIVENDEGGYVAITANVVVDAPVVEEPEVKPEVKPEENKPSSSDSSSYSRKHVEAKYTLTFVENGGSKIKDVTVKSGKELDLTKSKYVPTLDGYTFVGWFKDKALTKEADSILMYDDHTVYAKWVESSNKTNPDTGMDDMIDVAVALAVVSVAAGAVLATRKH